MWRKKPSKVEIKKGNPFPKYRFERELGKGGFAVVNLYKKKNDYIAIKRFPADKADSESEFKLEVRGYEHAGSHKHLVKFIAAFTDDFSYNVVMDYCKEGTLEGIYDNYSRYNERDIRTIVLQCCEALEYLRGRKVIHRDIKSENVLVKKWSPLHVVIADLNFSTQVKSAAHTTVMKTELGTTGYMAPEIEFKGLRKGKKQYNFKVDVYALGVVAHEMFTIKKKPDFDLPKSISDECKKQYGINTSAYRKHIRAATLKHYNELHERGVPLEPEYLWEDVLDEAKSMMRKMLTPIYQERASYIQILESEWASYAYPKVLSPIKSKVPHK